MDKRYRKYLESMTEQIESTGANFKNQIKKDKFSRNIHTKIESQQNINMKG